MDTSLVAFFMDHGVLCKLCWSRKVYAYRQGR